MIVDILKSDGPMLSTKLSVLIGKRLRISKEAARKRVSRAQPGVSRLQHLTFSRGSRFLYLDEDFGTKRYWESLFEAIEAEGGAYWRALAAVQARKLVPVAHFAAACGAPLAQKRHVSARAVLERMQLAKVLEVANYRGIGECILTRQSYDDRAGAPAMVAWATARLFAERMMLDYVREWIRKLGFGGYDQVHTRSDAKQDPPRIATFEWDLTAPSYLSPLTTKTKAKGAIRPGFVACDVLMADEVSLADLAPILNKIGATTALRNVGRTLFVMVGQRFHPDALRKLKSAGIIPATSENLFGSEIARALADLISAMRLSRDGRIDLEKFEDYYSKVSKFEGIAGNMRGSFFELLVAEVVRKRAPGTVELNRICIGDEGKAEVDIYMHKPGIRTQMIECKGMRPGARVDDQEVKYWLNVRIKRIRLHLARTAEQVTDLSFELWTSGILTPEALAMIERTKEANKNKYQLLVFHPEDIRREASSVGDKQLLRILEEHFIPAAEIPSN